MKIQPRLPFEEFSPVGFSFISDFISLEEEIKFLTLIRKEKFSTFQMHGVEARRKIIHYGLHYDFLNRTVSETKDPPSWMNPLIERVERALQNKVSEVLITHYPINAGIGWHLDAPAFESLLGISLLNSCHWQMRKGEKGDWEKYNLELPPRSAYIIQGEARWLWEHHIPPVKEERYSLTFRTTVENPTRSRQSNR
jgi:alkylated DNA repair protein (DNA oxidative demethylase)